MTARYHLGVMVVTVVPISKDKKEKRWANYGLGETNRHGEERVSPVLGRTSVPDN